MNKTLTAAISLILWQGALAQSTNDHSHAEAAHSVEVVGVRDPEAFNVSEGVEIVTRFTSIAPEKRSKIRLAFYLQTKNGSRPPRNVRLGIHTPRNNALPIVLLPTGELILPSINEDEAREAELIANVKRGGLRIVYFVQIVEPQSDMTGAYLKEALSQARIAWKALYGGIKSLSVPVFDCARGHYEIAEAARVFRLGSEVWHSESGLQVTVPLSILEADSVIDWGRLKPFRIGGCLLSSTKVEP